jgi:DNA polymerase V
MEVRKVGKINKSKNRHAAEVSKQTGFPSPATHYLESGIDLNKELVTNSDATFYIEIEGNGLEEHRILDGDVLIVDRSKNPIASSIIIVVDENEFKVLSKTAAKKNPEAIIWGVVTYVIHKM